MGGEDTHAWGGGDIYAVTDRQGARGGMKSIMGEERERYGIEIDNRVPLINCHINAHA